MTGIYKITSPTGKIYIGQSVNISERWAKHKREKRNSPLHDSIRKHGKDSHVFEVMHELPSDVSKEVMTSYEQFVLDQYREAGYAMMNLSDCAIPAKNRVVSEDTKRKISIAQKGRKHGRAISDATRFKINIALRSRNKPSHRKGIKTGKPAWNAGLKMSDEVKKKMSEKAKGRPSPMKGKKHSAEAIEKMKPTWFKKSGIPSNKND